jgi:hypothetical protein
MDLYFFLFLLYLPALSLVAQPIIEVTEVHITQFNPVLRGHGLLYRELNFLHNPLT